MTLSERLDKADEEIALLKQLVRGENPYKNVYLELRNDKYVLSKVENNLILLETTDILEADKIANIIEKYLDEGCEAPGLSIA